MHDLKFALRLLAKTPGFTAAAVIVLALGIGTNTAMFSVVRELVFSPRPYRAPDEVVQLYSQDKKNPKKFRGFSYPNYQEIREQNTVFTDVLAHNLTLVGVGEDEGSRRVFSAMVSANYFSVLGVTPVRGRAFRAEEEKPGAAASVVIASHLFWKKTGFDPGLVGRTIRVNERPFTVVGITPPKFTGTMMLVGPELYFQLGAYELLSNDASTRARRSLDRRDAYQLFLVGRLKPGMSAAAAGPALGALAANLETAWPVEQKDQTFMAAPLPRLSNDTSPAAEEDISLMGGLLLAMSGVVLLVACLNLANMLLARGTARRREIAIRLALGGGRARIIRQLLVEGFVLALAGGAGGLVLAAWSSDLLAASLATRMPVALFFDGTAEPAVFGATLGFCALATLFFALGPALRLSRADVVTDLKAQAGADPAHAARGWRFLPRHTLVVAQLALSLGLLIAAALFMRAAFKAGAVDTGFKGDNTILVEIDADLGGYGREQSLPLYRSLSEHLAALPGVQSAAVGATVPFGFISKDRPVQRAGAAPAADARPANAAEGLAYPARWNSVGADYFAAMGLPVRRGRAFSRAETDQAGAPAVAIADEVLARKLWPDGDALGQRIQWANRDAPRAEGGSTGNIGAQATVARSPDDPESMEIVGIVPATRWELFQTEPGGNIYVPFAQGFQSNAYLHVRPAGRVTEALLATVRREIRATAPGVPHFRVQTFRDRL
ncbi:MAG: hypothetical protein A3G75_08195, partial [Verrucomicrobia bacterium RIFCSPLOWO2_12_FULL_64_8]